jgi:hypothetical protein
MIVLDNKDYATITHALRVAAEQFDRDAQTMRDAKQTQLVPTFETYAKNARALQERIEQNT